MPVVSPSRYPASSTVTGSSGITKPYLSSTSTYMTSTLRTSYGNKTTEYKSKYSDIDGKKERKTSVVEYSRSSRAPSVTDSDSGISGRYRSERSESRSRDVSTTRSESSRTSDLSRASKARSILSSSTLAMTPAEFYNKYSPANYTPLTERLKQAQSSYGEIARSKSISNDIGRPPAPDLRSRKARNSAATISERPESRRYKESSPSAGYGKRGSVSNGVKDPNGNEVPSVSEIRKKFDPKMTVTKLPANDLKYGTRSAEQYLSQLKDVGNGTSGYAKPHQKDDRPVPVHLPSYADKNGVGKWDLASSGSRSDSNSDLSMSKTISEPVSLAKPSADKTSSMSASLNSKYPTDRLASIKSQLDPNNPIGKILENSTVIQVENGDVDYSERRKPRGSPEVKTKDVKDIKSDIEKQVKTPKHTTNFASYIQISQPVASGASPRPKAPETNGVDEPRREARKTIEYIDSEEDRSVLDNDVESPSGTGFENKTFEHENFLKKRIEKNDQEERDDGVKSMETSTESTISEPTDHSTPGTPSTPSTRRRTLDLKDYDYIKTELAGGKSGPSGLRRSSERSDPEPRGDRYSSQTSGLNGLRNIGNTCFMNSVLQCLSNTRPLLEYLVNDAYAADINTTLSCMKGALIKAFASVTKELWRSGERDTVVNTTALKSQVQRFAPRFMGYSQQDAQEFLRYLLEGLHEDVNRVTVKPKPILTEIDENLSDAAKAAEAWSRYQRMEDSLVGDIFVGQLKSTLRCTHCRHDSVTFDPFWDLSLPVPSRNGPLRLTQCLQSFTKEEELDGDEKPTCSKCGVRRKCLKWFTVQKFPQVLVLHLKRFSPTERFRGKLSVVVEFPLTGLDMSPYAANNCSATYNLYAVSNHSGTTYSGHYTAYCKHPYTGDWHEYNDSRVSPINSRDVVSAEAYVLFYELQRS
ncbi:ubiquitin carboxyl-terminal hydrolase 17-like [Aricia agestis]|uniref:ubiquitin carboxyl-terminal hydrolase 17-like n=1 Tax=Aricia agestis TaxID=91739 RepID=UPI001C203CCD|nr:ubiquitin carboxyl-terminal hydrolase 17-like [Aricia agestis]XP_041971207.1 ubiquitin carboxyl-terminal hydrolase 17-like [Aricia agestis]XP_041971208.1 ubiquitin carboxyl-terminal hydrolase 17-like [Aricia agestis]XP_041971209.1 ubiquitin carboxyl-terminal hydrolase 17-like [Aricia agestis]XP_041971210.1 ubiquitin carboxyl-terminal hydrolase 17-like [Aricia agestis]